MPALDNKVLCESMSLRGKRLRRFFQCLICIQSSHTGHVSAVSEGRRSDGVSTVPLVYVQYTFEIHASMYNKNGPHKPR